MKKRLSLSILILLALFLATNAFAAEKGTISGKVVEEVGGLSIPSAIVSVYIDGTDQPVTTSATDEDGFFSIKNLKPGNYRIKVSFVGYSSLIVNGIIITDKDFDKNLGALKLSNEQNSLQEVTITVQKPAIEFGADGVTYNVGSTLLAEGSTATDVLKNVPMVQMDIDGNATIAGKKSTRVFIDGKPSDYMTSNIADLLNVLPSDAIEKIEVLTNPPARYSGDGEGIINIVMKKGFKVGFNGNQNRSRNQTNSGDGKSNNFVVNADYKLQTDTSGGNLSIGLTFNTNGSLDLRSYNTTYEPIGVSKSTLQQNNNNIGNNGLTFNLDYDKPVFKKRDRIELGLAYNYRKNDNDLLVENFNFQTQQFVTNNRLSNQFLYNENILAGYASYNYRNAGWGIKTGVRTELTNVAFDLSTGENYNVKPYLSVFPNLSLNRFFKKRYNFGATYSVRINRPRENTLNPQVNNVDTLNISYGNPNLSPSYTHQMDISFGAFGQKWSFTPRLSYSSSQGVIERFRTVILIPGSTSARSESTFDNVGTNNSVALILIGNYRPTIKISANGNFSIIQSKYTSKLNSSLNRDGLSVRGTFGFSMQLPQKAAFESNLNYANNVSAQGRNKGSITSSFSARKMFFSNRLNFRITLNDIFGNRNNTIYNEGENFRLQSLNTNNTQNFIFSLNYRFTKIAKKIPPPPPAAKPQ
ncbi:MAG: TonB-dependent receptor [Pedobacter sp.]|nr:MAG: TonB-dependent receptor [Pedobacter sp.]